MGTSKGGFTRYFDLWQSRRMSSRSAKGLIRNGVTRFLSVVVALPLLALASGCDSGGDDKASATDSSVGGDGVANASARVDVFAQAENATTRCRVNLRVEVDDAIPGTSFAAMDMRSGQSQRVMVAENGSGIINFQFLTRPDTGVAVRSGLTRAPELNLPGVVEVTLVDPDGGINRFTRDYNAQGCDVFFFP